MPFFGDSLRRYPPPSDLSENGIRPDRAKVQWVARVRIAVHRRRDSGSPLALPNCAIQVWLEPRRARRCQIPPRTGGLLQRGIRPIDFDPLHCPQCMPWDPRASCESTLGWAREIFGSTKPVETSSFGKSAPSVVGLSVFHSYLKHQTCEEYIP